MIGSVPRWAWPDSGGIKAPRRGGLGLRRRFLRRLVWWPSCLALPGLEAAARLPGKHGDEGRVRAEGRRSGAGHHPLRAEGKARGVGRGAQAAVTRRTCAGARHAPAGA